MREVAASLPATVQMGGAQPAADPDGTVKSFKKSRKVSKQYN